MYAYDYGYSENPNFSWKETAIMEKEKQREEVIGLFKTLVGETLAEPIAEALAFACYNGMVTCQNLADKIKLSQADIYSLLERDDEFLEMKFQEYFS